MRVLVIGGGGFIGSRVVDKLSKSASEIVVMDAKQTAANQHDKKSPRKISGDTRSFSDVVRAINEFKVERIINLAYMLTSAGEEDPFSAIQINIAGTCNVFEAARLYGVERVVFCSSIAAYGPQEYYGDRLVCEDERLMAPSFLYGATKVLNEFLSSTFETRFRLKIPVLRIGAVYGGARDEKSLTSWTSQLLRNVVKGKVANVPLRRSQMVSFVHLDDVAEQLVGLCCKKNLKYRLYNSGGVTSSVGQFCAILKKYYPKADIRFNNRAPLWPYVYRIDGRRIADELKIEIRGLESGIMEQINEERASAR